MSIGFEAEGDQIYLLGQLTENLAGSEYLKIYHSVEKMPAPEFDLEEEHRLHRSIRKLNAAGLVRSIHDLSEGGLFISLLESSIDGNKGFSISMPAGYRKDALLFGEAQSRVAITLKASDSSSFEAICKETGIAFHHYGEVKGDTIQVDGVHFGTVEEWKETYTGVIESLL